MYEIHLHSSEISRLPQLLLQISNYSLKSKAKRKLFDGNLFSELIHNVFIDSNVCVVCSAEIRSLNDSNRIRLNCFC